MAAPATAPTGPPTAPPNQPTSHRAPGAADFRPRAVIRRLVRDVPGARAGRATDSGAGNRADRPADGAAISPPATAPPAPPAASGTGLSPVPRSRVYLVDVVSKA